MYKHIKCFKNRFQIRKYPSAICLQKQTTLQDKGIRFQKIRHLVLTLINYLINFIHSSYYLLKIAKGSHSSQFVTIENILVLWYKVETINQLRSYFILCSSFICNDLSHTWPWAVKRWILSSLCISFYWKWPIDVLNRKRWMQAEINLDIAKNWFEFKCILEWKMTSWVIHVHLCSTNTPYNLWSDTALIENTTIYIYSTEIFI